ncbi:hypothetical protein H9P43_003661 [Blastocladiella emersonii ATCC 22665]|nr:hypothetical protein H9P43_003657 [Blastocladiella emersonii ATCC 22665]KAI9184606.1 hypothetical protein H9P43_003661 [Blastocladiella emersonii ATCC 22665]
MNTVDTIEHTTSVLAAVQIAEEDRPVPTETTGTATATTPQRTVLLPLDDSKHTDYTVQWAKKNFLTATDRVVLVTVRPTPSYFSNDMGAEMQASVHSADDAARDRAFELVRSYAKVIMHPAADGGVVPAAVEAFAMRGDAREALLRKAGEVGADVIVMGSRGLGAIKRTLLGSVSSYLAQNASCPVIIVRDTDKFHAAEAEAEKAGGDHAKLYAKPTKQSGMAKAVSGNNTLNNGADTRVVLM